MRRSRDVDTSSWADKLITTWADYSLHKAIVLGEREGIGEVVPQVFERDVLDAYRVLQEHGIKAEPSAAVAFAGLKYKEWKADDHVVVVNTGEGLYNKEKVMKAIQR